MFRVPVKQFYQRVRTSIGFPSNPTIKFFHSSLPALRWQEEYGRGGRGNNFRSGGRSFDGRRGAPREYQPDVNDLSFSKVVKIDPEYKLAVADMDFTPATKKALEGKGIQHLTPVQSQSFEPVLAGEDIVARSRTGTGKTLAFGIPIIEQISRQKNTKNRDRANSPLVLVIEPTRELALQVSDELSIIARPNNFRVISVFGGSSFEKQQENLRRGVEIVVATPGRLIDHINQGTINLSQVTNVVLDEGDLMLEMGFQNDVETILNSVRERRDRENSEDTPANKGSQVQLLLFSATMPSWICSLTERLMTQPTFLDAVQEGETRLATTITHYSVLLPDSMNRFSAVLSYIEDIVLTRGQAGQTIVFTNTKDEANQIAESNCFGHLTAAVLHGDVTQSIRQNTLRSFREKKIDVLVATDVAARGLDISGVELVVHISPPRDADSYVHRSGRTGRAGRPGTSLLFYSASEQHLLKTLQRELKFNFTRIGPPTPDEITDASVQISMNKLQRIEGDTVDYFRSHAQQLLEQVVVKGKVLNDNTTPADDADDKDSHLAQTRSAQEALEDLVARCLATISHRTTITSRSMITGREGFLTLKFLGNFSHSGDASTRISDFLSRTLKLDQFRENRIIRTSKAKNLSEDGDVEEEMYLCDFPQETAKLILNKAKELGENPKIQVSMLQRFPDHIHVEARDDYNRYDRNDRDRRFGDNRNDRSFDRDRSFSRRDNRDMRDGGRDRFSQRDSSRRHHRY